jgi:hypothetical protein|tara:strand:+ start:412 stop:1395 length:984 start_codon:yes stop_codon:yes gene_type:complete
MCNSYWDKDEFPGQVETVLFAMSQPLTRRKAMAGRADSQHKVSRKEWNAFRSMGAYIPPGDQLFATEYKIADLQEANSVLLDGGDELWWGGVRMANCVWIKQCRFPPNVKPKVPGVQYRCLRTDIAMNGQFLPMKEWFTVANGKAHAAISTITDFDEWGRSSNRHQQAFGDDDRVYPKERREMIADLIISGYEDRKRLWTVKASGAERSAATFGVHVEQIQSLFYARDAPLTAAGRKRPVLHWVEAHQRRMKNGTEVAIPAHVRGVTDFVMEGTRFEITSPAKPQREEQAQKTTVAPLVALVNAEQKEPLSWWKSLWNKRPWQRRVA